MLSQGHATGRPLYRLGLALGALAMAGPSSGALSFRSPETLPSVSLRIPLMAGARTVPIPPARTFRYTLTRGAESWQEDRFDAYELWYAAQHAAEWIDAEGTRIVLGMVHSILPAALTERHVTAEQYEQLSASAAAQVEQVDTVLLHRWMTDFAGLRVGAPEALAVNRSRFADLWLFPAEDPRIHAFIFRMDPRRAGQAHVPEAWFGLVVTTAGEEPRRERDTVVRELLGGIEATGRFEHRPSGSRFAAPPDTPAVRPHPSREAAKHGIRHLAEWWAFDSDDYVALSNHREARRFVGDLLAALQSARLLFAALVPPLAPGADEVSVVRIFATDAEYEAYVGAAQAWTSGLFDASRRELIIRPSALGGRGARFQAALQVALHEGFHQYLFQATGGLQASPWFNEGHATFFEVADLRERRLAIEEHPERAAVLERLVAAPGFSLRSVLTMDYPEFYGGTDARRQAHYSLAWGLVYYLQRGAPLERKRPHAALLENYLQALVRTRDPARATAVAFDGIELDAFDRAFVAFWKSSGLRSAARRAPLRPATTRR